MRKKGWIFLSIKILYIKIMLEKYEIYLRWWEKKIKVRLGKKIVKRCSESFFI